MINKICSHCKMEKKINEFNFKNKSKGIRANSCRDCQKIWKRNHYINNKQYYYNKNKQKKIKLKLWITDFKSKLKCEICDENHPACLDFHHINPEIKEFEISSLYGYSYEKILQEIDKCRILCSNCHRKLHYAAIV